jgi:predicted MFS family arabinose efflux permease
LGGEETPTALRPSPPWRAIFSSKRVWAIIVAHVAQNYGFYTLLNELPTYMKQILHFDIKENSLLSAVPYLAMWFMSIGGSLVADYLRKRGTLSTTATRKSFNSICKTW